MQIIDLVILSLKNIMMNKTRTFLVSFTMGIGIFMILIFSVMQDSVLDIEKIKSVNNPEYQKISISQSVSKNTQYGINLNEISDINNIKHVRSINLVNSYKMSMNEDNIANHANIIIEDAINDSIWINDIKVKCSEDKIYVMMDGFNPFDLTKIIQGQRKNPEFQVYLYGRELQNNSTNNEVIIDDITAFRLGSIGNRKDRKEAIEYMLDKKILLNVYGQTVEAKIVGIYNYQAYMIRPQMETLEDKLIIESFENYKYTEEELLDGLIDIEVCFPMFFNESIGINIDNISAKNNLSIQSIYEDYNGYIEVIVDDIVNLKEVTIALEEKLGDYLISSKINEAENALNSFIYFRKVLLIMGIIILIIAILTTINTVFMIIDERQYYMGQLLAIGFPKQQVLKIIIFEIVWMGLLGCIIGFLLTISGNTIIEFLLHSRLYESGLYKFINIRIDIFKVMVLMIISLVVTSCAGIIPVKFGTRQNTIELLQL